MTDEIRLYDAATIGSLEWPQTELGIQAKGFLLPLMQNGVECYVSNVKTRFCILKIDDIVLPLTVNEEEYQNSYVASNYYAVAGMEEWFSRQHSAFHTIQKPLVWSFGKFLQWVKINRIVMVNNWLFSTNLYPLLKPFQVEKIATFLRERFPDHAHIFRGVNTLKGEELYLSLKKEDFNLIKIRQVYIYDPKNKNLLSPKVHYHHRRDLKLVDLNGYSIIGKEDITKQDIPRLLDLYKQIYLEKYTPYSPSYTSSFLLNALDKEIFDFIGVKKDGKIDGIMGFRILNGMMSVPFFGYEMSIPQSVGLYRMMSVLAIKEAERRGVMLNDSSGASTPKKFRGLKPHSEYLAIYDQHLPWKRRLFWAGAGLIVNKLVFPIVKKFESK